jgi:hypothetical protein
MEFATTAQPPWRRDDPTAGIKLKPFASDGHATWSEEQIAAFEGATPHRQQGTACNDPDAIHGLPSRRRRGAWSPTHTKRPARVHSEQEPAPKARDVVHPSAPRPAKGHRRHPEQPFDVLGDGVRQAVLSRRLRQLDAGPLRRSGPAGPFLTRLAEGHSRRMAEAKKTPHKIMSVTGHRTLSEVTSSPGR